MVMTAAAATVKIFRRGQSTELERFADVLLNTFLHLVHFLLGVEKIPGDRVLQERVPLLLEVINFGLIQLLRHLLLLLEGLAFSHDAFILGAGLIVGDERINPPTNGLHGRFVENSLAQLLGLLEHRRIFDRRLHNDLLEQH